MMKVKSLNDLSQIYQAVSNKRRRQIKSVQAQLLVGMGSCGIAAGARETLESIEEFITAHHLSGIQVIQTGCIGFCGQEPILQVIAADGSKIIYGKVTPKVARRVISEHIIGGMDLPEYVVQ
ncbi:MAG: (2Fe-2S) ferredoxin domain-containing protein [Chloroflexi bacterium]|nr:(2Fe-2S) ferredoxin domain-containing protein [Chloroflexota bacterium]